LASTRCSPYSYMNVIPISNFVFCYIILYTCYCKAEVSVVLMPLPPNTVCKSIICLGCSIGPFVRSSSQILLPRHLVNGLNNFDKIDGVLSSPCDDLIRFWRSKVKVNRSSRSNLVITISHDSCSVNYPYLSNLDETCSE